MKRKSVLIYILMILIFLLTSCSTEGSINKTYTDKDLSDTKAKLTSNQNNYNTGTASLKIESDKSEKTGTNSSSETDSKSKSEEQIKSGQPTSVPWENDVGFKTAQANNDCMELMAAYRTVLHDPLPGEEDNVHLAAQFLKGNVVKPGEVFSQNGKVGPYTEGRGFQKGPTYVGTQLTTTVGGGVCKIASTLYNVSILSNLPIVERHFHNMPVPYVPYGQDATVAYGAKDFKFKNNKEFPILIWAQGVDNVLYIGFYGKEKPSKVEWHHETLKVLEAPKVYKVNPDLASGTEKVVIEGMNGGVIKSWVTIEEPDGTVTTKQLGTSYYNPMSYVIEKGK